MSIQFISSAHQYQLSNYECPKIKNLEFNDKSAVRAFLLCMIRINVSYDILDIIKEMYKNTVLKYVIKMQQNAQIDILNVQIGYVLFNVQIGYVLLRYHMILVSGYQPKKIGYK